MALPTTRGGHVLGRRDQDFPAKVSSLSNYLAAPFPNPPASVAVPNVNWNIDGNDVWGDCTIGSAANFIGVADAVTTSISGPGASGGADLVPTPAQCITQYQALTGAKTPGDSHDTGLVIASVVKDWTNPGLFGDNKIAAGAPVSLSSLIEIKQTISSYGAAYVGVNLPQSAEDQTDSAPKGTIPVWSYVGDKPIGGHCILFVGYDAQYIKVYTWGMIVKMELAWFSNYVEEVWALIPQSFVEAGKGPTLDLASLRSDLNSLSPKPPKKKHWWSSIF